MQCISLTRCCTLTLYVLRFHTAQFYFHVLPFHIYFYVYSRTTTQPSFSPKTERASHRPVSRPCISFCSMIHKYTVRCINFVLQNEGNSNLDMFRISPIKSFVSHISSVLKDKPLVMSFSTEKQVTYNYICSLFYQAYYVLVLSGTVFGHPGPNLTFVFI